MLHSVYGFSVVRKYGLATFAGVSEVRSPPTPPTALSPSIGSLAVLCLLYQGALVVLPAQVSPIWKRCKSAPLLYLERETWAASFSTAFLLVQPFTPLQTMLA